MFRFAFTFVEVWLLYCNDSKSADHIPYFTFNLYIIQNKDHHFGHMVFYIPRKPKALSTIKNHCLIHSLKKEKKKQLSAQRVI